VKVYLAGTINTNDDYFQRWRYEAARYLKNYGIMPLSPLVSKELNSSTDGGITSNVPNSAIMIRDRAMVNSSHLVLANLKMVGDNGPCDKPFIGTFYELAWAWDAHKPVIAVVEPDNYLFNEHPFLKDTSITQKFATLEEALQNIVEYWNWGWERPDNNFFG
jgi:nucleoside 2-deoxyribosyltransferase